MRTPEEIMRELGLGSAPSGDLPASAQLAVKELRGSSVELLYEDSLAKQGAGGHPDTDLFNPHLFWEPPPVRMFILKLTGDAPAEL